MSFHPSVPLFFKAFSAPHLPPQIAPLLILHGLLGSSDNWITLAKRFGEYQTTFALDVRNHGQSPHHPEMTYPLMALDLFNFMEHHALRQVDCLGHSMGGKAVMEFALTHPNLVRHLVVVDMAPKNYPPVFQPWLDALVAIQPEKADSRQQIDELLATPIPNTSIRQFILKNLERNQQGRLTWKIPVETLAQEYPNLTQALATSHGRSFPGPTLFIRGENSNYITDEDWPAIKELFPLAHLTTLPGASHWVHADAPDAFFKVCHDFLSVT